MKTNDETRTPRENKKVPERSSGTSGTAPEAQYAQFRSKVRNTGRPRPYYVLIHVNSINRIIQRIDIHDIHDTTMYKPKQTPTPPPGAISMISRTYAF